jgi:hypothetical protein
MLLDQQSKNASRKDKNWPQHNGARLDRLDGTAECGVLGQQPERKVQTDAEQGAEGGKYQEIV